jgi:hypothetical protein
MAVDTLASRLVRLEQTVAQRHNTSLNPQASLDGLDPEWVADEIAHRRADAVYSCPKLRPMVSMSRNASSLSA